MSSLDPSVLAQFGIDMAVEPVRSEMVSPSWEGPGQTGAREPALLSQLLAEFRQDPHAPPEAIPAPDVGEITPQVRRKWDSQNMSIAREIKEDAFIDRARQERDWRYLLDHRDEPAALLVRDRGELILIQVDSSGQAIFHWLPPDALPPPSEELKRLGAFVPQPPVPVAPPDMEALLQGAGEQGWLKAEVAWMVEAESTLLRASAAGLSARLWDTTAEGVTDELKERLMRGDGPTARAAAWFASLPEETRTRVRLDAMEEAAELADALPDLQELVIEEPSSCTAPALSWLHQRDNLESVLLLFSQGGDAGRLAEILESLDRKAAEYHSIWSLIPGLDKDPRLRAVAWQEPDCWWGGLILG